MPLLCYDGMKWSFHVPRFILLELSVFVLLWIHFFRKKTVLELIFLDLSVFLYFCYVGVQSYFTGGGGDLFNRTDVLFYFGLFYLVIQLIAFNDNDEQQSFIKRAFYIFFMTSILLSLYGILQYFGFDPLRKMLYPSAESRVIATMGNANSLGGYLAAAFPFSIYSFRFEASGWKKKIILPGLVLILIALILTLSRGAWLGLAGGMLFLYRKKIQLFWKRSVTSKMLKIGLPLAILIFSVFAGFLVYRVNPDSAFGRIFIWKVSAKMIDAHPIVGIGYGRYGVEYLNDQAKFFEEAKHKKYESWADNLKGAKNECIQILAETGIIGLVVFLTILFLIFYQFLKIPEYVRTKNRVLNFLVSSLVVILIHSLVEDTLYAPSTQLLFWFDIGIFCLIVKQSKEIPIIGISIPEHTISFKNYYLFRFVFLIILIAAISNAYKKTEGFWHWQKGQNFVATGKWQEGIKEYKKALKIFPRNGELQFHLGSAYSYTQQPEKAIVLLSKSPNRFNDKNLYIVMGYTLIQLKRFKRAELSFEMATKMYPQLLLPHLWLAQLYKKEGRKTDAAKQLKIILKLEPKIITEETIEIKHQAQVMLNSLE